jgi:branched-chain amino acid transport system permease protein
MVSFAPVIMTMIGGIGSFFGPIWGAAIFQILEELTSRFTDRVELVVGLILILTILFAPGGLAGLIHYVKQRWLAPKTGLEKAA